MKELLSVKKMISLILTLAFFYLSVTQKVSSTEFITIFTVIIGFYFGQSTVKGSK